MTSHAEAQLERLWRDWHRHVLAYALRRTDAASAHDVVAETFAVTWRRLEEVPEQPLPWLLGVARRVLANATRGNRRRLALLERLQATTRSFAAARGENDPDVLRALAVLPEADREALLLIAWEGLSNEEAASVMGCSPPTFAVRLHRARARLSRELQRSEQPVPSPSPVTEGADL